MDTTIPAAAEVVARIEPLTNGQLQRLSELSGVPFTTLWKIRSGETTNPRIDSASKFWPYIEAAQEASGSTPEAAGA